MCGGKKRHRTLYMRSAFFQLQSRAHTSADYGYARLDRLSSQRESAIQSRRSRSLLNEKLHSCGLPLNLHLRVNVT